MQRFYHAHHPLLSYNQFLQVERATSDISREIADTLEEGVRELSSTSAIRNIQKLVQNPINTPLSPSADAKQASNENLTFEQCFYVYGGRASFDELQQLSDDCAESVRKLRDSAPHVDAKIIEERLARLNQILGKVILDMEEQVKEAGGSYEEAVEKLLAASQDPELDADLLESYAPMRSVCVNAAKKAEKLYQKVVTHSRFMPNVGA